MTEEMVYTHTHTHKQPLCLDRWREAGEREEVSPDCCQSSSPVGGPERQADRREL